MRLESVWHWYGSHMDVRPAGLQLTNRRESGQPAASR